MISQTEKALIGSLLVSPGKFLQVSGMVKPEDFSDENAKKAYVIAHSLWSNKKPVDLLTVAAEDMTLATYLSESVDGGSPMGCARYADTISCAAKTRRITDTLKAVIEENTPPLTKLDDILSLYQREMEVERKDPKINEVLKRFESRVSENRARGTMGISTGFSFLDDIYVQYVPGHIWTMGAFTSIGKTAMMVQKLCNLIVMEDCPSTLVVSTEMTEEQMMSRVLANFTGVHSQRILAAKFRPGEEEIVEEYKAMIKGKPVFMYDGIYTLPEIEMVFRQADLQGGVDIGFIDYVQNCQVPGAVNDYQTGAALAKGIQKLAKDVRATIVCLSQVSNDVGRGNTDQLELKGAGEWAAVSDVGIMLGRKKGDKYSLKYSIKKNRHGALHDHRFEYKMDFTRLEPMEPLEG